MSNKPWVFICMTALRTNQADWQNWFHTFRKRYNSYFVNAYKRWIWACYDFIIRFDWFKHLALSSLKIWWEKFLFFAGKCFKTRATDWCSENQIINNGKNRQHVNKYTDLNCTVIITLVMLIPILIG